MMNHSRSSTIALPVVATILACGSAAPGTDVGITPDSRHFTMDGTPVFLNGWDADAPVPVFEDLLVDASRVSGQYGSGTFSATGYRLTQSGGTFSDPEMCMTNEPRSIDFVWYDLPGVGADGTIEFDVSGLHPGDGLEKNELMAACDSTGLSPATSAGEFYNSLYYMLMRKINVPCGPYAYHSDKMKVVGRATDSSHEERTNVLSWSGTTTYRFQVTWSGTVMRTYRGLPGAPLTLLSPPTPFTFGTGWSPATLHIQLGSTFRAGPRGVGESGGAPGTVYSLLRVYTTDIGGVATSPRQNTPAPPVIVEVTPDPDGATVGTEYVRQLQLVQGSLPVTWSVVQGPAGLQVDGNGRVSGWTPGPADAGHTVTLEIRATNQHGTDTETWQVQAFALPARTLAEFPFSAGQEGWTPQTWKSGPYEPGTIAWDSSGGNPTGHLRATGSGGTNNDDSCTREGARIVRLVSTAKCRDIQIRYDVMATLNTPPAVGCSAACLPGLLGGSCEDQFVVSYSTTGPAGPWTVAQTLSEGTTLPPAWTTKVIDLAAVEAVSHSPAFALKFEWQFNTAGDSGRIDNIRVLGNPALEYLVDFDDDRDVDQSDFGYLQRCCSGSGQPYEAGCTEADLDGDGDVDQTDFASFEACLGGPNQLPACI